MERLLTVSEVAERGNWSGRFVRKLIATGRFGPELLRVGRTVRVRESDFLAWLAAGCPARALFERRVASAKAGGK